MEKLPIEIMNYIFTFIQSNTNEMMKQYLKNERVFDNMQKLENLMKYRRQLHKNPRPIDILYAIRYFKHFKTFEYNTIKKFITHIENVSLYKLNF